MQPEIKMKSPRIEVADALRGFAVLAIILIHNVEHFNLYFLPEWEPEFLKTINSYVWEGIFFFFGGKAYAIFALLFGFSFYIQFNNRQNLGKDFSMRFAWRLVLLFLFGLFNAVFYPGDILSLYAIVGFTIIPVRKLSDRIVMFIAAFFMLQPVEIGKIVYALFHPDFVPSSSLEYLWENTLSGLMSESFLETVRINLLYGEPFSLLWAWDNGRFFQTSSLFMIGMLLGRNKRFLFSAENMKFWKRVLLIAVLVFIPVYLLRMYLSIPSFSEGVRIPLTVITGSLSNVFFMAILVSSFILLWYGSRLKKVQSHLVQYGRMSLTNYITQSILGSFIYFAYGLGMYQYLGSLFSLLTGIIIFVVQLCFCKWWLKHHKQGPFERLWHNLTWINSK